MEIAAIIFKCSGLINEIEEKDDIKLFEITRINKGYPSLEISKEVGMGCVWFEGMSNNRIDVITYSGYRGEETPRSILIHNEKIEVVAILNMWIEEGIEDRVRRRFFKVKGSDGKTHKIYYDEKEMEWFYMVED